MNVIVKEIINRGTMGVLVVTGGGTGAISELLCHGGGSKVLLEAIVPYGKQSAIELLGEEPAKFVSVDTTEKLAEAAYKRAVKLSNSTDVFGLAANASLTVENEREGRTNIVHVGICTGLRRTVVYSFNINKATREEQEAIVSRHILETLHASMMNNIYFKTFLEATVEGWNSFYEIQSEGGLIVMPGSFNPIHEGHLIMADVAKRMTGKDVHFEISITNVDKPDVTYESMMERVKALEAAKIPLTRLHIVKAAKFVQKMDLYPKGTTFVVGFDTWQRMMSDIDNLQSHQKHARYMLLEKAFEKGAKFIVFGRVIKGLNCRGSDIDTPKHEFFNNKGSVTFVDNVFIDMSSSKIRSGDG